MKLRMLVTVLALAGCVAGVFGIRFQLDRKRDLAIAGFSRYREAETRAGRPLGQHDLLSKWLSEESANRLGDPTFLGYFSAFSTPHSANPRAEDPLFAAALARFQEPVRPGMEFSFVPFAISREPFIPPACAFRKLDEAVESAVISSDPRRAVDLTIDRHRRLAAWNNHCCGIYELILRTLDRLSVCGTTLKHLESGQLDPSEEELALMQSLIADSSLTSALPNALLYERTFIVENAEKLLSPASASGWHPLADLRREEARHLLLLVMAKALDAAATTPPSESPTVYLDGILANADSVIRSSRTLCPSPGLQLEWDKDASSLIDARLIDGLKTAVVKEAAYQAILAAHRQRKLTGVFPVSLDGIQTRFLQQPARVLLHESNARLVAPMNEGSSSLKVEFMFMSPDGTVEKYPAPPA